MSAEQLLLCAGLSGTSLYALSKLMSNVEVADDIIGVIRHVIGQFSMKNLETDSIEVPISVKLWRVPGCHELLASLGKTCIWEAFLLLKSNTCIQTICVTKHCAILVYRKVYSKREF
jgi:hypothetical protein